MTTQPEALRLADEFEKAWMDVEPCAAAAAELRRLHSVNLELLKALIAARSVVYAQPILQIINAAIAKATGGAV